MSKKGLFMKKKLIILYGLCIATPIVSEFEVGKYDGGEYCARGAKTAFKSMYPNYQHLKMMLHEYGRGGDAGYASLYQVPDFDKNYWTDNQMNFQIIRDQFPIFKTLLNGKPIIYFDSGATAQMPQSVIDAVVEYYQNYRSNVGRGLYAFAEKATQMFELSRSKIAKFIGAKRHEIIFTSGATAAINLAAHAWVEHHVTAGDEIVVLEVEHNANFIPWLDMAKRKGAILKRVPLDARGLIDFEIFKSYITPKTKFVALTQQSNILGILYDLKSLIAAAHEVGAKVLVDAAQSIAHHAIDVVDLDCDFLAFSGHKMFGPTGVGVLFMKESLFDECKMFNFGGGMVFGVTADYIEFKAMPYCFEPGTQAIGQVIGLGAAVDFIQQNINFDVAREHETKLALKLINELKKFSDISILSVIPQEGEHVSMVTFSSDAYHAYDIAEFLDKHNIAVRAGYHCAQPYHDKMGGAASVRVTFSVYNTQEEVDYLIEILRKIF
jgi:cysteine desulfurase/selenocysteine lyase